MNVIWTLTTIVALVALTVINPQSVLSVCVDSGTQALRTALSLTGIYCLWLGIFQIAEQCHLVEKLSRCFAPLNKFLYGKINQVASNYISLNLASNLLGVGNAATPSAIAAIKETEHDEKLSRTGAMLFVVNATSVQLVPTTVIGLRASLGSVNPADVLVPNLISTLITSVLGVALVFLFYGRGGEKQHKDASTQPKRKGLFKRTQKRRQLDVPSNSAQTRPQPNKALTRQAETHPNPTPAQFGASAPHTKTLPQRATVQRNGAQPHAVAPTNHISTRPQPDAQIDAAVKGTTQ